MKPWPLVKRDGRAAQAFAEAVRLHQQGFLRQAETIYRNIVATQPDHVAALHSLGYLLFQQDRSAEALRPIAKALKIEPRNAGAWSDIGLVHARLGHFDLALASYDKALALKPDHVGAHYNRGDALFDLGRPEEAVKSYDAALALKPDYADALVNRGNALKTLGRLEEALASYDGALAVRPDFGEALVNRGNVLKELRRLDEALASYERALALRPDFLGALVNRANALEELGRHDEALESYDKALALEPNHPQALLNRGNALKALDRPAEALESYDRAIALHPGHADAHGNRALILTELGRFEEASGAIAKAIELAPAKVASYFSLIASGRLGREHPYVRAMEDRARDMRSLPPDEQIELHFALGKAYADMGDHERCFPHWLEGNAVKRRRTNYDEASVLTELERLRTAFRPDVMHAGKGLGEPSEAPIFVLGMPRSGTTLVEQILASHPRVFGAGEIDDFDRALEAVVGSRLESPEALSRISGEDLRRLGADYVERIKRRAPAAERIVNKTPENFRLAGLLHLALPNARILHTRRGAVDTCVSCFSKRFAGDLPYAYDLGELGRYYHAYETLMAHWRAVLPAGAMLDVRYEDLVADLEGQSRRILAYCGLDWDPRCLDFHRTERLVRTASATQVRQPIYLSSVGRWRPYERFLAPLLAALEGRPPPATQEASQPS